MLNSIVGSLNSSLNPAVELHCKFIKLRWTNIGLIGSSTSPRVQRIFVFQFVELLLNSDDSDELRWTPVELNGVYQNSTEFSKLENMGSTEFNLELNEPTMELIGVFNGVQIILIPLEVHWEFVKLDTSST